MQNCTSCGAPLEPNAAFCVVCGAKATSPTPASAMPARGAACPQCGALLEPDATFCVACGAGIASAPTPASQVNAPAKARRSGTVLVSPRPQAAPPATPPATPQLATPSAPASNECPQCGATLMPDSSFCVMCGTPITQSVAIPRTGMTVEVSPAPATPTPMTAQQQNIPTTCPSCGAPLEPDADFCTSCGERIPGTTPRAGELAPEEQDMRTQLVFLTQEEARKGCTKVVQVDGQQLTANIPAGTNGGSKLDFAGYGYPNSRTGERGVLRLTFYVS